MNNAKSHKENSGVMSLARNFPDAIEESVLMSQSNRVLIDDTFLLLVKQKHINWKIII